MQFSPQQVQLWEDASGALKGGTVPARKTARMEIAMTRARPRLVSDLCSRTVGRIWQVPAHAPGGPERKRARIAETASGAISKVPPG